MNSSESTLRDSRETIASVLRQVGFSVVVTTRLDDGFPQLVIGAGGLCVLAFVKTKHEGLTGEEHEFRRDWSGGPILTLRTPDQALAEVGDWFGRNMRRRRA